MSHLSLRVLNDVILLGGHCCSLLRFSGTKVTNDNGSLGSVDLQVPLLHIINRVLNTLPSTSSTIPDVQEVVGVGFDTLIVNVFSVVGQDYLS